MSADNVHGWDIAREVNTCPRSKALRANVKIFRHSLSWGYYQPTYQQARRGLTFFYNPPVHLRIARWQKNFVDFFIYSGAAFKVSFSMSLSLDSRKRVRVFFHFGQLKKPWVYSVLLLSTQEAARTHTKKKRFSKRTGTSFQNGKARGHDSVSTSGVSVALLPNKFRTSLRWFPRCDQNAWDLRKFCSY